LLQADFAHRKDQPRRRRAALLTRLSTVHELAGIGRERIPITWTHLIEKVLLKFKELEHVKPKSRANFLGMLSWETPPVRCPSMAAHILTD